MNTITLTDGAALAAKYAIELARVKSAAFEGMTDEEVFSHLINMGVDCREVTEHG